MIRKLAALILVGLIQLTLLPGQLFAQSPSATLSLSPATGTFNKGCTFSVDIALDTGGVQTDGTDAILLFDSTRFNALSIRSGTIYSDYPGNNFDNQTGKVTVSGLASVSQAFSGKGTLASVEFKVVDSAPAGASQIKFEFDPNDKAKTTDSNVVERGSVADALNQATSGNFVVGSGTCGASPTPTQIGNGGAQPGVGGPIVTTPPTKGGSVGGELPPAGDGATTAILAGISALLILFGFLGISVNKKINF